MEQTITGLENGAYEVVLFSNAFYTDGRGFGSDITDGQEDVVYLFANDTKRYIPAHIGTSVSVHGEYTLVCNVTDGTLHLGMSAAKAGNIVADNHKYINDLIVTAQEEDMANPVTLGLGLLSAGHTYTIKVTACNVWGTQGDSLTTTVNLKWFSIKNRQA